MKNFCNTMLLLMIFCSVATAQKIKGKYSGKDKINTTHVISTANGEVITSDPEYDIVFGAKNNKFDKKNMFILTKEGKRLKIGKDQIVTSVYQSTNDLGVQSQAGPGVTNSITYGNGGNTITISTTITSTTKDGTSVAETKTTTIDCKTGETSRSTTVTHGQGPPDGIKVVVIE